MTTENQINQTEPTRDDLLVAAITAQAQELIACKLASIEKDAASMADNDDGDDKPVMAKATIMLQWEAGATSPTLTAKLSWSVRHQLETETRVNPDQLELGVEGGEV